MRAETFEIRWHDTQPIYSCSFQPIAASHLKRVLEHNKAQAAGLEPGKFLNETGSSIQQHTSGSGAIGEAEASSSRQPVLPLSAQGQSWRFATAGGDNHARIWLVHPNIPSPAAIAAAEQAGQPVSKHPPRVEYRATLRRHSGVVNCVRFCPKGELLATTGDDGMVLTWIPSDGPSTFGAAFDDDGDAEYAKEHWRLHRMNRATSSEIYDMAWSPNGEALVIGGTDFVARIINAGDGTIVREIAEHNHYIQGVTWDPLSEYIATQSSDRSVHVHHLQGRTPSDLSASQTVSRNSRMEVGHRRQTSNSGGHFVWDPNSRPPVKRRASSHASDSERETSRRTLGRQTHRSSTPMEGHTPTATASASAPGPPTTAPTPASSSSASAPIARAATPTLNQSPAAATTVAQNSMNPPQRTPSRRSSFNGSAIGSPPTSATSIAPSQQPSLFAGSMSGQGVGTTTPAKTLHDRPASNAASRSASRNRGITPRSPSPAPPLPAIRAPPSPKQRMAALQASAAGGAMARVSMRLYGDENFSGFFRRLTFSPDGALLATPTGIFESMSTPVNPSSTQTPLSPSLAAHARTSAISDAASPQSPNSHPHGVGATAVPASNPGPSGTSRNTVFLYARGNLHRSNAPIAHLPGHKTATLAVKFSPILYELRRDAKAQRASDDDGIPPHPTIPLEAGKQKAVSLSSTSNATATTSGMPASADTSSTAVGEESDSSADAKPSPSGAARKTPTVPSMIGLPYRMIFAVATHDSVWIYDTQQGGPLCCFSNMHYASFTDLTWSPDGQTLMMCSTDGYCSGVVFDYGELGTPYSYTSQPSLQATNPTTKLQVIGSPTIRRSALAATPNHGHAFSSSSAPHATPPHAFASTFPSALSVSEASPSVAMSYSTSADAGAAAHDREVDPLVVPEVPSLSTAVTDANAPEIKAATGKAEEQAGRKKRRIAPTLEGPIGS